MVNRHSRRPFSGCFGSTKTRNSSWCSNTNIRAASASLFNSKPSSSGKSSPTIQELEGGRILAEPAGFDQIEYWPSPTPRRPHRCLRFCDFCDFCEINQTQAEINQTQPGRFAACQSKAFKNILGRVAANLSKDLSKNLSKVTWRYQVT